MWLIGKFGRRRRRRPFSPFNESELPEFNEATVDESVAEGLMLAEYASRMRLKNAIIIDAIAGQLPFDASRFIKVAKSALDSLITESERHADRVGDELRSAAETSGVARHAHDYQLADARNLEHRLASAIALTDALAERRSDSDYLAVLVERARSDAWADVSRSVEESLDRANIVVDASYERGRDKRARSLARELDRAAALHE